MHRCVAVVLFPLLLLLLFLWGAATASPGLVCESRAAAVALVQAAAAHDARLRFVVDLPPPGGSAGWDVLLVDHAQLVAADDATTLPATGQDVYALQWATAPAWRPAWPLVAWAVTLPPTLACAALAADTPALVGAPLPLPLERALDALYTYETMLSRARLCPDTTQFPQYDAATDTITCDCLPDMDCVLLQSGSPEPFAVDTGLLWALGILALILTLAAVVYSMVAGACTYRHARTLAKQKKASAGATEALLSTQ